MKVRTQKTKTSSILMVASAVIMLAFSVVVVLEKSSLLSKAQSVECIQPNLFISDNVYYGRSQPASLFPVGALIEIFNSRNQKVNCFTVTREGILGFTSVFSEAESLHEGFPGMQENEEIIFKVNGTRIYPSEFERFSTNPAGWRYVNFLPVPPQGVSPVISTSSLPNGQVGVPYLAIIKARDVDMGQTHTFNSVSLVPSGLHLGSCQSVYVPQLKTTEVVCKISGTPTQATVTQLTFVISDSGNRTASKTLGLTIR